MVSTRARTQSKDIEKPLEAGTGGGIKAPARRNRTKKVESETQREERPKATTKKVVIKNCAKVSKKPDLRDEDKPQDGPKTENKGRSRATSKPTTEPEVKVTKRTRAKTGSVDTESKEKTRLASRTIKSKEERQVKTANKAALKEKPKIPSRKGARSKTQATGEQKNDLTTPDEAPNSDISKVVTETSRDPENPKGEKTEGSLQNVESSHQISLSPIVTHPSKLSSFAASSQPASLKKSAEQTLQTQAETVHCSPSRSLLKSAVIKLPATTNLFRSSALVSPEKSLGSPRKPPVAAKLLSSRSEE